MRIPGDIKAPYRRENGPDFTSVSPIHTSVETTPQVVVNGIMVGLTSRRVIESMVVLRGKRSQNSSFVFVTRTWTMGSRANPLFLSQWKQLNPKAERKQRLEQERNSRAGNIRIVKEMFPRAKQPCDSWLAGPVANCRDTGIVHPCRRPLEAFEASQERLPSPFAEE
jgi:hypothetical protein